MLCPLILTFRKLCPLHISCSSLFCFVITKYPSLGSHKVKYLFLSNFNSLEIGIHLRDELHKAVLKNKVIFALQWCVKWEICENYGRSFGVPYGGLKLTPSPASHDPIMSYQAPPLKDPITFNTVTMGDKFPAQFMAFTTTLLVSIG